MSKLVVPSPDSGSMYSIPSFLSHYVQVCVHTYLSANHHLHVCVHTYLSANHHQHVCVHTYLSAKHHLQVCVHTIGTIRTIVHTHLSANPALPWSQWWQHVLPWWCRSAPLRPPCSSPNWRSSIPSQPLGSPMDRKSSQLGSSPYW